MNDVVEAPRDSSFRPPPALPPGSIADPRLIEELIRRRCQEYDDFVARGPPRREEFTDDVTYEAATRMWEAERARLEREVGPLLAMRVSRQAAATSPAAARIIALAERQGVRVTVLSDDEYQRRYPGTVGVTIRGGAEIVMPASSVRDPDSAGVLIHELTHALLKGSIGTERPLGERIEALRTLFEQLGMNPDIGERIAEATDGWPQGYAPEHVVTYLMTRAVAREQQGLPPETSAELAGVVDRVALRELALSLQRDQAGTPPLSDEALLERWLATPQGRENPPPGSTDAERIRNLKVMLERYADESSIEATPSIGEVDLDSELRGFER